MGLLGRKGAGGANCGGAPDAAPGRTLLESAVRRRAQIVAPSRLSEALITAGASTVRVESGSPLHRAIVEAALLGYACRLGSARPVAEPVRVAIEAHLVRTPDGRVDHQRLIDIPDALYALLRTAVSLATSGPTMAAAAGVSDKDWLECCSAAGSRLRAEFLRSGLPAHRVLDETFLSTIVRLGTVLCVIDELAGESPRSRGLAT